MTTSSLMKHWRKLRQATRIVIKIGTKSLLSENGDDFDYVIFARLAQEIQLLLNEGREVMLVSSGAVSAGVKKLKMKKRPRDLVLQQVAAAVGSPILFKEYTHFFGDTPLAQILVTQDDLSSRKNYVHFQNAIEKLLRMKVLPILNENDVVSIDELAGFRSGTNKTYSFSDNDMLSALVTAGTGADVLIILSDVDGFYSGHPSNPDSTKIPLVERITPENQQMVRKGGAQGRGGMVTKLKAAEIAMRSGAYMVLCNAKTTSLKEIFQTSDTSIGTLFSPVEKKSMRDLWLLYATNTCGRITVDAGAKKAINKGASLLFPGISDITGEFARGDVVEILDQKGFLLGKGITNLSRAELMAIFTKKDSTAYQKSKRQIGDIISRFNMSFF